ncbi:MAG: peptidase M19 [Woeseia sp.]|nr:peptidase M19 [Woeseia sp.]
MNTRSFAAIIGTLCLAGCEPSKVPVEPQDYKSIAQKLSQNSIIIDTHIDVPYRIIDQWEDVSKATETGDFDYPRAVTGGLNAPFMSIYTPASLEKEGKSKERAEELIKLVKRIANDSPEKFAIALSPDDIERQFEGGKISLPMGMENGSPIEGDLNNIQYFFDEGIRYITLAHSLSNHISDSSYDDNKFHGGLSDFGRKVVLKMNQVGMIIDISHVSDAAFWEVIDISTAPVIASHSSARHFTPGFERNMSDEMIQKLAENEGVIMINYGSAFLTSDANRYSSLQDQAWEEFKNQKELDVPDKFGSAHGGLRDQFDTDFARSHPYPFANLDQTLDHFDHVVKLTGSVDYVGIGSDYDGVGDTLPTGLKDVSSYPNLVEGLLIRGYSEEDIRKILGGNLLRVWRAVEAVAQQ